MLSGSTALITTTFKCPSMKPSAAALTDALPASIRKMQAAATELGINDIRTKDKADSFHYSAPFSTTTRRRRGPPAAALFPESTDGGYGPPRSSLHIPCECVAA